MFMIMFRKQLSAIMWHFTQTFLMGIKKYVQHYFHYWASYEHKIRYKPAIVYIVPITLASCDGKADKRNMTRNRTAQK